MKRFLALSLLGVVLGTLFAIVPGGHTAHAASGAQCSQNNNLSYTTIAPATQKNIGGSADLWPCMDNSGQNSATLSGAISFRNTPQTIQQNGDTYTLSGASISIGILIGHHSSYMFLLGGKYNVDPTQVAIGATLAPFQMTSKNYTITPGNYQTAASISLKYIDGKQNTITAETNTVYTPFERLNWSQVCTQSNALVYTGDSQALPTGEEGNLDLWPCINNDGHTNYFNVYASFRKTALHLTVGAGYNLVGCTAQNDVIDISNASQIVGSVNADCMQFVKEQTIDANLLGDSQITIPNGTKNPGEYQLTTSIKLTYKNAAGATIQASSPSESRYIWYS